MKKKYNEPTLEIAKFQQTDVIATSGFDGEDHIFSADFAKI